MRASRGEALARGEELRFFPVILELSTLHIWEILLSNSLSDRLWFRVNFFQFSKCLITLSSVLSGRIVSSVQRPRV